ncbi:MAG: 2-succinyl-5-enolpyruvyl-6-hydroxy-3-cyclohexene-1-carboxylic-acid synthase [Propionibacteriales bacterium]|nr:2-succinyl-5-enolpyruvyl-6-hydroxy-3-cyclohexene-1-carboxylic-acid synthase [Propionibacteriales bacterium]
MNPSTALARVFVDELVRGGMREVVLAPGSRSAPLALELHAADRAGRLRLHVRVDERSAGFLAVGLAKTGGSPVGVVMTSGTAVANLHPAVLEASHAGIPVVVLSADRPAYLRGTGAIQTTDQAGLFGRAVRLSVDLAPAREIGQVAAWRATAARALAAASGARSADPGPVQVNLQFPMPLVPDDGEDWPEPLDGRPDGAPWTDVGSAASPGSADPLGLDASTPTVVVAGDDAGPPARLLAESADWPLLAEPTSGARTGTHALRCYRLLLDGPLAGRIERVVVCGHPTLSRPVTRLLGRTDLEVAVVTPRGGPWADAGHAASRVVPVARVEGTAAQDWLASWRDADKAVAAAVDAELGDGLGPHNAARVVSEAVPPRGLLVVGSSHPVRDLDLMASPYPPGKRRKVIANRGLSGIDGTVSTAIGAALARRSSRSIAYLGDLTFLHDCNGLLIGPEEPRPDLTLVVQNDDGGSIFATVEQGAPEYADAFERVFGTPVGADLSALCAATGTPYRKVDDLADLRAALARPPDGIEVVEVPVERTDRRLLDQRLKAAAARAQDRPGA